MDEKDIKIKQLEKEISELYINREKLLNKITELTMRTVVLDERLKNIH